MKVLFALLFLICPLPFSATIIVMEFGPERIIIAADSRQVNYDSGQSDSLACKIVTLDKQTVFFSDGVAGFVGDQSTHHVEDFAKTAFNEFQSTKYSHDLVLVLARWVELTRNAKVDVASQRTTDGIFAGTDGNTLTAYTANIMRIAVLPGGPAIARTVNIYQLAEHIVPFGVDGSYQFVAEFLTNKSSQSATANLKFREDFPDEKDRDFEPNKLRAAVEYAIERFPRKGIIDVPVDVLVIDRTTGVRWVHRKNNCK
jgi:hypothetical protein